MPEPPENQTAPDASDGSDQRRLRPSGGKNIAEGSRAAATTSQTELRLVNVARASLEELLLDYEDYLRQHRKRQWDKNDAEALAVRGVGREVNETDRVDPLAHWKVYARWLEHADPAVVANALIRRIKVLPRAGRGRNLAFPKK